MDIQRFLKLRERPLHRWLLLWAITTLLYLPAWKGGFQQDFEGWLYYYHTVPFWELMNRSFAGIQSFYHVTQFQLYLLTKLFDVRPYLWFLLFTGLHGFNGELIYRLARNVMADFGVAAAAKIAAAGTLLVLFNPAMTEVVVWKASYHYLVGVQAIFWCMLWAREYLLTGRKKYVWRSLLLFIPITFTLEIWYTIPVLIAALAVMYRRAGVVPVSALRNAGLLLVLPMLLMLGAHLVAYHAVHGLWIAHSAYTSPGDDSAPAVMGRVWSYEFHLLGLGRFFSNHARATVYTYAGGRAGGFLAMLCIIGFTVLAWRRFPYWGARARAATLWFGCSLISIGIILHFIPSDIMVAYNDRYLYFTAFFQYMLVALGISYMWERAPRAGLAFYALTLAVLMAGTGVLVLQWRQSTKVFWAVQDKFRWQNAPSVLLLNLPTNYNGMGIIQAEIPSELPDHMYVFHRPLPHGRVYDVAGYNMQHPWDGANVKVEDSAHLTVTLNQWGSWWWRGGFGAKDYENDTFAVRFTDPGHYYQLTLKKPLPAGSVLLYQQGLEWRVVDMTKIGVEQR